MTTEQTKTCGTNEKLQHIIILEPDELFAQSVATAIWMATSMTPCIARSNEEGLTLINEHRDFVFAAVLGFESEDAPALFDAMTENDIPSVAYGVDFSDEMRNNLSTLTMADVVVGTRRNMPDAIGRSVGRLVRNQDVAVLVVDDSRSMRQALIRFLETRQYALHEAADGVEALEVLRKHPEIKLVTTANEMPGMDGYALVKEIRKTHSKDELAVIGISAGNNAYLSVRFINNGANDFLKKPFLKEELYCRVDHNVEMIERIQTISDLSNKDPMTQLYNRRYFFDHCDNFMARAEADGRRVVTAMLDIDHFKQFNDTYGHDVGDEVIIAVARQVQNAFPDNAIVCRFGGEEFCVLAALKQNEDIFARYDYLRRVIELTPLDVDGSSVTVTISIGATTAYGDMDSRIKVADTHLYEAKKSGRNRVVIV